VFDTRKVRFDHLAGEVVLPESKKRVRQPARSPFICAFRAGWRRIALCSVHIYFGKKDPNDPRRVTEIDAVAKLLAGRNTKRQSEADGEPDNVILLGDFNIFNREGDKTSKALERHNFVVPDPILKIPGGGNMARNRYYDQIAFHDPRRRLRTTAKAGVFEFTKSIFGADQAEIYADVMLATVPDKLAKAKNLDAFYREWRTFQISDHYPLWIELQINFADPFLATAGGFVKSRKKGPPAVETPPPAVPSSVEITPPE
jgi:hypothetical protein